MTVILMVGLILSNGNIKFSWEHDRCTLRASSDSFDDYEFILY